MVKNDDVLKVVYHLVEAGAILIGIKVSDTNLTKAETARYLRLFTGLREIMSFINTEKELPNAQNN
jgi:hypothetical protein